MLSDNSLRNIMIQPKANNHLAFGISTLVKSSLQITLFMQNKANFRKSQMNVTKVLKKNYEKLDTWWTGKKQSQTKPNKANFKKAKMNVTSILTVDYENKPPIWAPKKQTQSSKRQKPMQTSLPKRIMKKTAILGYDKTKPNKPNFTYPQRHDLGYDEAGVTEFRCRIPEITCLWQL